MIATPDLLIARMPDEYRSAGSTRYVVAVWTLALNDVLLIRGQSAWLPWTGLSPEPAVPEEIETLAAALALALGVPTRRRDCRVLPTRLSGANVNLKTERQQ